MFDGAPVFAVFDREKNYDAAVAKLQELGHDRGMLLKVTYASGSTFQQFIDGDESLVVVKVMEERRKWRPKTPVGESGCGGCPP